MKEMTTVWIIEDDEDVRSCLEQYLNLSEDLRCTAAFSNCESALNTLKSESAPEILLIDLGLPGMSGIEGIAAFKEKVPDIEPLVLTVDDSREKVFSAIQAGASGYLLKTADVDEIVDACRKVAQGETSLDGNIARMMLNSFRKSRPGIFPKKTDPNGVHLTEREIEILKLLAAGNSVKMIADQLEISENTVKHHCKSFYKKLHAQCKISAIVEAQKRGII